MRFQRRPPHSTIMFRDLLTFAVHRRGHCNEVNRKSMMRERYWCDGLCLRNSEHLWYRRFPGVSDSQISHGYDCIHQRAEESVWSSLHARSGSRHDIGLSRPQKVHSLGKLCLSLRGHRIFRKYVFPLDISRYFNHSFRYSSPWRKLHCGKQTLPS